MNPEEAWERLEILAPGVDRLDVDVHHALAPGEQQRTAPVIGRWLRERCPALARGLP